LDAVLESLDEAGADRAVVLSTIQALQQIHSGTDFARLEGRFGTVLFDEGHREPAPVWAQAVRELSAPTVLFSATQFRNDLKIFDVDLNHVHFLSFRDAVNNHLIRSNPS
jgi:superfamily II DNA or RNA helicase